MSIDITSNDSYHNGNIIFQKSSGTGIKVDTGVPTYPWCDLIGQISPHVGGGTAPVSLPFIGGNINNYCFDNNTVIDSIVYHIPHDYVPGSDLFLHLHWGHNGTAISGNFVITWHCMYAKGHQQASFQPEIDIVQTIPCTIGSFPRYQHNITEFQITNGTGDATHLLNTLIEPDGILIIGAVITSPTITGSSNGAAGNHPFIFTVDLHYQSTGIGTKQKAPNFYV